MKITNLTNNLQSFVNSFYTTEKDLGKKIPGNK